MRCSSSHRLRSTVSRTLQRNNTENTGIHLGHVNCRDFSCIQWVVDTGENLPMTERKALFRIMMRLPEKSLELKIFTIFFFSTMPPKSIKNHLCLDFKFRFNFVCLQKIFISWPWPFKLWDWFILRWTYSWLASTALNNQQDTADVEFPQWKLRLLLTTWTNF